MGMRSSVTGLVIFCIEGSFELGSLVVSVRQGILDFLGHGASVPLGPTKHVRGRYRSISGGKFMYSHAHEGLHNSLNWEKVIGCTVN